SADDPAEIFSEAITYDILLVKPGSQAPFR
ncbi:MAG: hypothetical protein QOD72_409, partial [Acidimicrobiaceae bacterium]|nr:hypothetical protein [Acidimicrobiaceae bacterium]